MNLNTKFSAPSGVDERIFFSEISKIFTTCELSKKLIIGIYLIKENKFLYCNKVFEKVFGHNAQRLIDEGWDFWYSIIAPNELSMIKNKVYNFFSTPLVRDILTLQYHIIDSDGNSISLKHEILVYKLKGKVFAINYFFDESEKEQIERCLQVHGGHRGSGFFKDHLMTISSREKQVLKLIADGFSSKQIADKLFISNHTAISHRKHLIQKFQVKNTAQLIKEASKVLEL
ncbi:helix-turn-helix transcriptional regulator [Aquimarina sp. MMG016]|uniref:response regulator transcription factor n=1 Tax=Aquimarina sp. MMG016 TaxID=2822690 RepID=UPI001B3A2E23|nr:helix-turn-helix transcriptional regulator [Aquimarina sp. MMG016]MBQ4818591.1 LuxR family transcriptional regulator [Aquimarina sp. MMG016]